MKKVDSGITEVILLGKRKDHVDRAVQVMNSARRNFETLFNGLVLGMNHDPEDEDCVLIQTEGKGLKIRFGPKGTLDMQTGEVLQKSEDLPKE